ncbi:MAG: hypothetical protein OQK82_07795 [Candidatus Pacearchaeota archaeon]|nr:hypothetical protein [Candidatus Pacearchaeota archaeon]
MGVKWYLVMIFLLMLPFCSSTIIFYDSFGDVYNVGDMFYVNFSVEALRDYTDFVEASLNCDGDDFVFFKKYYSFTQGEKRLFDSEFPLSVSGDCAVEVSFDEEDKESRDFEISDDIEVSAEINALSFSPGETVSVSGEAVKENGEELEGYVEISFLNEVERVVEVEDGQFSAKFVLEKDILAGVRELKIKAVEENYLGEVINSGEYKIELVVKSMPSLIEVESENIFSPPYGLNFSARLLDQGGGFIENKSIVVKLFDANSGLIYEGSLKSGGDLSYEFLSDAVKGRWDLNFYYGSVFTNFPLYVEENPEVKVSVGENNILIDNVGNVFYEGVVSVDVNNGTYEDVIDINVNLSVGEGMSYFIDLEGYYNLSVGEEAFENVYLTGAFVFFDPDFNSKSFVVVFVIIGFFLSAYFLFRKKDFFLRLVRGSIDSKEKCGVMKNVSEYDKGDGENSVYVLFLKFEKGSDIIENSLKEYGFSFKRLGDNVIYVLITSRNVSVGSSMFGFARKVRRVFCEKGFGISIVIHSGAFGNKVSVLKNIALTARKLIKFSNGMILLTKEFCDKMGISPRKVEVVEVDGNYLDIALL